MEAAWNFCAPVVDYDALRKEVATVFADKAVEVQGWVAKLQRTQRAVEQTLDKCARRTAIRRSSAGPLLICMLEVREDLHALNHDWSMSAM